MRCRVILSDAELQLWWDRLTNADREDLFELITENGKSMEYIAWVRGIHKRWKSGYNILPKEIATLKKWDKS